MIILTGPSASGKTVIALELAKKYGIKKAITTTTREMRVNEIDGVDYYFVNKKQFEQLIKEDKLVEHALYSGNYYGCGKTEVADNKVVVLEANGVRSFLKLNDKNIVVFYINASEEIRKQRMIDRQDKPEKIIERIKNDKYSFPKETIDELGCIIINQEGSIEDAAEQIYNIYKEKIAND